jgi:uncharacterized protein (DUF58 family)
MRRGWDFLPAPELPAALLGVAAGALLLRVAGLSDALVARLAAGALLLLGAAWLLDRRLSARAWEAGGARLQRRLPQALALGVRSEIRLMLACGGDHDWRLGVQDHADDHVITTGLPARFLLSAGQPLELVYGALPVRRGRMRFAPAELRIRSRLRLGELCRRLGDTDRRRVFPDFSQIARYGWLVGDRRLADIGIRNFVRRGEGTDFRQLAEYQPGDSVRHIDWKASARAGRPIVREFQDERDQSVVLLLDCGRRMRADDPDAVASGSHFDHVLNGVLLLAYVALRHGDAVGALPFATGTEAPRFVAPRKGSIALNGLMAALGDLQPTLCQPDYLDAARALLGRQRKRALVVIVTNSRDEDGAELRAALRLLRTRHLVMVASLRERVVAQILRQPLTDTASVVEVAGAHLYLQGRQAGLARLAMAGALLVDAEPRQLGIGLVNAYQAAKRAQLL